MTGRGTGALTSDVLALVDGEEEVIAHERGHGGEDTDGHQHAEAGFDFGRSLQVPDYADRPEGEDGVCYGADHCMCLIYQRLAIRDEG